MLLWKMQKRLEGFAERVEADLNHEMSRMFEDSETRTKRHVPHEIPLIRDNEGYWATEKWSTSWTAVIGADWKVTYGTLSMTPFVHKDIVFWIATSIYHRDNPGVTGVYMMTMVGDQPRIQYSQIIGTKGANECIPILMNDDFIEIVCAESFGGETTIKPTQRGSCVIRVTWTTGSLDAKVVRTLATRNAVDVTTL
ncbi:unnamed protein product [Meganyctiphanes norvegica]|uniref:Uncharacterized protein n=1 Tax=Meganyctiphanes norvegica TaxID=48144 RepID=A0AAV2QMU6_MEGNR